MAMPCPHVGLMSADAADEYHSRIYREILYRVHNHKTKTDKLPTVHARYYTVWET